MTHTLNHCRNQLAAHLAGPLRVPPPMLKKEYQCSRCFAQDACAVYHKVTVFLINMLYELLCTGRVCCVPQGKSVFFINMLKGGVPLLELLCTGCVWGVVQGVCRAFFFLVLR